MPGMRTSRITASACVVAPRRSSAASPSAASSTSYPSSSRARCSDSRTARSSSTTRIFMARIVRCAANPSPGLSDFLAAPYPILIRRCVPFATLMSTRMTSRTRTPLVVAGLIAALALGIGLGAAAFAVARRRRDDGGAAGHRRGLGACRRPRALGGRGLRPARRSPSSRSPRAADHSRARRDPASCTTTGPHRDEPARGCRALRRSR